MTPKEIETAIERYLPKEPVNDHGYLYCPNCERLIYDPEYDREVHEFCHFCGQHIETIENTPF